MHALSSVDPSTPAQLGVQFSAAGPLGGAEPTVQVAPPRSDRRELLLTSVLLLGAILVGATSLMPWRDYGQRFGASVSETGWVRPDGSMGRGGIVVALGVLLAVAGVLIASGRGRAGRILASLTGSALVVYAVAEWGLGLGSVRAGPGAGLWADLILGVLVVVAVGVLGPKDDPRTT